MLYLAAMDMRCLESTLRNINAYIHSKYVCCVLLCVYACTCVSDRGLCVKLICPLCGEKYDIVRPISLLCSMRIT